MSSIRILSSFAFVLLSLTSSLFAQVHPRLFFGPDDVAGLRAKALNAPHSEMLAQMIKNIHSVDYNQRGGNFAAAYLLTGNETYARMGALRAIDYISNTDRWANNSQWGLRRGIDMIAVAHLFDFCYNSTTWASMTVPATLEPEAFDINGITTHIPGTGAGKSADTFWHTSYTPRTVTVPSQYVGLPLRQAVSLALKLNADSLMASGGGSWPGNDKTGNNWHGVRYASAALGYLLCDETGVTTQMNNAVASLKTYLTSTLGSSPVGMGWSPEGVSYAQFPGWFTYPLAIALKRNTGRDLVAEHPAMRYALWSTYMGTLPIQRNSRLGPGLGSRPDFDDDHNVWEGEGTGALAFAFAFNNDPGDAIPDFDYRPGLKWMFRRITGDLGDRLWDTASGNGIYAFLYYPHEMAEQNPDQVWGRTYYDPTYGAVMFRSGHQDADFSPFSGGQFTTASTDFVFQTTANTRSSVGGHGGPDDLTFRILGLGVPWAVGSGRVWDVRGQTALFPYDPSTSAANPASMWDTEVVDSFLRNNTGDGYVVMRADTTSTGVSNLHRRMIVDYSGSSGAPAFFVISDSCNNTTAWWRQQTLSTNTVDVSAPGQFVITSPEGHCMIGKILHPAGVQVRTGTFQRGNEYFYKTQNIIENRWVDFPAGSDGHVLIALAVVPSGQSLPTITATGNPTSGFTVTAGSANFALHGDQISSPRWHPPSLNVASPGSGQAYVSPGGNATIAVSGNATDADGTIAKIEVFLDDVLKHTLPISAASFNYGPVNVTGVALGVHTIKVVATDSAGDTRTVTVPVSVTASVPPSVEITHPTTSTPLLGGQSLIIRGRATDPENALNRVEIWSEHANQTPSLQKLGNAVLDAATGTWSYTWTSVPVGRPRLYALAVDNAGDQTQTATITLTGSLPFAADPLAGDAANYSIIGGLGADYRWSVANDAGELVLRGRPLSNFDYNNYRTFLEGSNLPNYPDFEAQWRAKMVTPMADNPQYFLNFGNEMFMDFQIINGVEKPYSWTNAGKGTRVWLQTPSYRSEVAWGENLHRTTDPGYPNNPGTDRAGIPDNGWHDLKVRRVGKNLKVWRDNILILDGTDNTLGTRGLIGFGSERNSGSEVFIDDVTFTPLTSDGTSASDQPAVLAFTAPADFAQVAAGQSLVLSGTASDPDGLTTLALYRGSVKVADLPTSGSWSHTWSSPALGQYSFHLQATDARGFVKLSAPLRVTVAASAGSGGNQAPTVTIGQNGSVLAPNFGLTGSAADPDGSIAAVQILRDGSPTGFATVTGGTWNYTVTGLASGTYQFTARAIDNHGVSTNATFTAIVDGNAPPTISNVADTSIPQDGQTAEIAFTVGDDSTPAENLIVTASSSNNGLVPVSGIVLGGSGGNRTVRITPAAGQSGVAVITLTVTDGGGKTASDLFSLQVTAPPVATAISVMPASAVVTVGTSQQFTAVLNDQFGQPIASQPTFTWSVSGGGSISPAGLFTAASSPGNYFVTATASNLSGNASFSVAVAPPANTLVSTGFEGYPASGAVAATATPAVDDAGIASGTWEGVNWSWKAAGLSYTNANGTINGGSRALDYTGSNYQLRQVHFAPATPIAQTVFIRFLAKLDTAPTGTHISGLQLVINNNTNNNNNNYYPGFGIMAGGPGRTDGYQTNNFFASAEQAGLSTVPTALFGGTAGNAVHLIVARLAWSGSKFITMDVWADPTSSDANSPDASIDISGLNLTSLSKIGFRGGSATGGPSGVIDELVIATGWNAVVPSAPSEPTTINLAPTSASLAPGTSAQFTATILDQYGTELSPQPPVSYSVNGGGAINASGLFTAGLTTGGPHTITATSGTLTATALVTVEAPAGGTSNLATYAGAGGIEEFKDVLELSDGTVLVAGSAENLDWISAPKTQLAPGAIPNRATGRTAFVMRLASDLQSILGVWHLPAGQAHDIRWIKTTSKPGSPTGTLYVSGTCDTTSGDYFIARLDNNFVAGAPTAFSWVRVAKMNNTYGDNLGLQTWDVGGDGRVAFLDQTGETIRVFFLDASGNPLKLPALRGSHWASGATLNDANRQAGIGSDLPATSISGISFPADLRSWTDADRLAVLPDGNGEIKRGTWPLDLFTPVQDKNGGTSGTIEYGYTGYKSAGKYRIGGIAFNRDTNDFSIGFNVQSKFWDAPANKEQPDFEPAVIAYSATGALKWWSRLYHEVIDADKDGVVDPGETRLSSPDQYVDGLAVDYSNTPARIVVLARCHGNNTSNLWKGNTVAANPGGSGFQNQFTGTEGNIHLGWIGKLRDTDGTLLRASYLSGYFRGTTLTQSAYADPNLDGWPSHNAGWPNLTTTRAEPGSVRTDSDGRVYVVGTGPRMVTTSNAFQKLPKITNSINEGTSPWAAFARVYDSDLATLVYSTAFTGAWTYPSPGAEPEGANNTDLRGIFPTTAGVLLVGSQRATAGLPQGNPVPVSEVPGWGSSSPQNVSALFARLPFSASTAPVVPNAPSALLASAFSATQVDLTWQIGGGSPTGHRAEYRPAGAGSWTPGPTFPGNATAGSVTGLTPATAYEFRLIATNSAGDSPASNTATATTPDAYTGWIASHPGVAALTAPLDDPDGDGTPNLLEYAFDIDPSDPSERADLTPDTSGDHLTLTFTPKVVTGLRYIIEASSDLSDWSDATDITSSLTAGQPYIHTDSAALGTTSRRFLRLRVEVP